MYHIVYLTTNLINNKIYVGVHSTFNLNDGYKGTGTYIRKAFKKYGKENFKRQILFYCIEAKHAYDIEAQIVDLNFTKRKDTYNVALGDNGGIITHTTESKLKISEAGKGRIFSDERKQNISKSKLGKQIHTLESKLKISEASESMWESDKGTQMKIELSKTQKERFLSNNPMHNEESRNKLSESRKGMKFSDTHRKNIGLCRKGVKQSPEHIQNAKEARKRKMEERKINVS